jgi:Ca-activated chloride channel family protein
MLLVALLTCPALAQGLGQLRVIVVDDAEQLPVAGATLALSGSLLTSDANGEVLFTELLPGPYELVVSKAGFGQVTLESLQVNPNRTTTQIVHLVAGTEEIVVSAERKAVDTTSTAVGQVLAKEFLQRIPAGRTYQSAVQTMPAMPGNTESYQHPGHSPLVMADQDRLSTFAVDVDTASYALARAKLTSRVMPPPASVRVEEFVNAFRYAWAPPAGRDPLAIRMEAAPHPSSDRVLLSVALQGHEVVVDRPVRLTFLVDVSGSMDSPDKLPLVQKSLHELVDGLGLEDRVGIVTYAGNTGIALQPSWTVDKAPLHQAIDELSSSGSTAMGAGIELAYGMASKMYVEGAENRVIILTDGDANVGISSAEQLLGLVNRWAGQGIMLSVIGFGQGNYKDALLERMADRGDGNYHYVDSEAEAQRIFGRDRTANLVTLARDVKVQVEFPEASVLAWRQIGYENRAVADEDFRDDAVDGGEVGSGHQVTALYELVLRDEPVGDLARVRVRAEPPGKEAAAIEFSTGLLASARKDSFADASADLRFAFGVATFAELLRRSPHTAEVRWADVLAWIEGSCDPRSADHSELRQLIRKAASLSGGLQATVTPEPVLPPDSQAAR